MKTIGQIGDELWHIFDNGSIPIDYCRLAKLLHSMQHPAPVVLDEKSLLVITYPPGISRLADGSDCANERIAQMLAEKFRHAKEMWKPGPLMLDDGTVLSEGFKFEVFQRSGAFAIDTRESTDAR